MLADMTQEEGAENDEKCVHWMFVFGRFSWKLQNFKNLMKLNMTT